MKNYRLQKRLDRKERIRVKVNGTAESPRLSVFKSAKHIYAQIIDDQRSITIASASTLEKEVKETVSHGGNVAAASKVGELLARRAMEKNVSKVVFDRGGFKYHGCVKALADKARETGLKF